MRAAALALAATGCGAGRPDPSKAVNITMYHIAPLDVPATPVNSDLGDAAGDMFFDLTTLQFRFDTHGSTASRPDKPNLGISEVVLETDGTFGPYGTCNICDNGTSPINKTHPCTGSEYVCDCNAGVFPPQVLPCEPKVGLQKVEEYFGAPGIGRFCEYGSKDDPGTISGCWTANAATRSNGLWYSPLTLGHCDETDAPCSWRLVKTGKRVHRECHQRTWHGFVEQRMAPGCVDACADSGTGDARNYSSTCWTTCWFEAALGKEAGYWPVNSTGGIPIQDLVDSWLAPFKSDDPAKGGCPDVPY